MNRILTSFYQYLPKFGPANILTQLATLVFWLAGFAANAQPTQNNPKAETSLINYDYKIVKTLPHSSRNFTQGLVLHNDHLIETSGLYGKSFVQRYHPLTNQVLVQRKFPRHLFAEGAAIVDDQLYVLTWKQGVAFRLDPHSLIAQEKLFYEGDGWGLTQFNHQLVMSDGSHRLSFRSPKDFSLLKQIAVSHNRQALSQLNDLTFDGKHIWANVWYDSSIYGIDPQSGVVIAEVDLSALSQRNLSRNRDNVLNGIAWDKSRQGFWVTGKRWKERYFIVLE